MELTQAQIAEITGYVSDIKFYATGTRTKIEPNVDMLTALVSDIKRLADHSIAQRPSWTI